MIDFSDLLSMASFANRMGDGDGGRGRGQLQRCEDQRCEEAQSFHCEWPLGTLEVNCEGSCRSLPASGSTGTPCVYQIMMTEHRLVFARSCVAPSLGPLGGFKVFEDRDSN